MKVKTLDCLCVLLLVFLCGQSLSVQGYRLPSADLLRKILQNLRARGDADETLQVPVTKRKCGGPGCFSWVAIGDSVAKGSYLTADQKQWQECMRRGICGPGKRSAPTEPRYPNIASRQYADSYDTPDNSDDVIMEFLLRQAAQDRQAPSHAQYESIKRKRRSMTSS